MPKVVTITCDNCGKTPDPKKNLLMLGGNVLKFDQNGPRMTIIEQYFCNDCTNKILEAIGKLNDETRANTVS